MRKQLLVDAVKIASNIHQGDFSSLRGKSFLICDNMKKKKRHGKSMKKSSEEKMTLTKLATIVNDGFRQVNTRLDRVENRLEYIVSANNLKDLPKNKKI